MTRLPGLAPTSRRWLSVDEVSGMLELQAYGAELSTEQVAQRSRHASLLGLAAVICRPEHLGAASQAVAGTGVGVCTVVDFHTPGRRSLIRAHWPRRQSAWWRLARHRSR